MWYLLDNSRLLLALLLSPRFVLLGVVRAWRIVSRHTDNRSGKNPLYHVLVIQFSALHVIYTRTVLESYSITYTVERCFIMIAEYG
jgi:hypothetical protein